MWYFLLCWVFSGVLIAEWFTPGSEHQWRAFERLSLGGCITSTLFHRSVLIPIWWRLIFVCWPFRHYSVKLTRRLKLKDSVTRFGEILPLWHNFKILGKFLWVCLVFDKILLLHCQKCYGIGQIFIAVDGQIIWNHWAIWSHCLQITMISIHFTHPSLSTAFSVSSSFFLAAKRTFKYFLIRQETWYSGYGRRLIFRRSWVRISASYTGWTFSHLFVVKIVLFVWKDENKRKKSREWPI